MGERSEVYSSVSAPATNSPPAFMAPVSRRWLPSLRGLTSRAAAWWRDDEAALRALAAIDDERVGELSEEGRALRRAARRRVRIHT